jgi:phosphatidylserine/phosphatidylglycerophosphate/cardiolipin synthase-like enzyme
MEYSGSLILNNDGDDVSLFNATGGLQDALVYGDGDAPDEGWLGPALQPYNPTQTFPKEGQILSRKRDQRTGLPVADTDSAAGWAQDPADAIDGCKVQYPGWDLDAFFFTQRVTETATVTVTVGPDNLYGTIAPLLAGASESIQIQSYSFRSRELAEVLLERLDAGVDVTMLLEGNPAFEGVSDEEAWIAGQLADRGARVRFMINDSANGVHDRYRYQHAKVVIIDGDLVLIGSENLNPGSMPADDKTNGTAGRRGVYLVTDAPGVVGRVRAILDADGDPANHADVVSCDQMPSHCSPPPGFEPAYTPDWVTYTVQFPSPLEARGTFAFEVLTAPESGLRDQDGLLGLLGQAGEGDTVLVEMFYSDVHWGPDEGTPEDYPNPRLAAYLSAARRGAQVRILLDGYFDAEGENQATIAYLRQVARSEGLDLEVRLANPTFLGLHNKMVLAHIAGLGYAHVGSINGNEASSKVNREVALQVQSDAVYRYLKDVFDYDWSTTRLYAYAPLLFNWYEEPRAADHLLISEVYYRTVPEKEWVEVYNPTDRIFDLWPFKLGDAAQPDDAEAMLRFPWGTEIGPGEVLVVATTATGFWEEFPTESPDLEMVDTDPAVPNMRAYDAWGTWDWGLGNDGDEIVLLGADDVPVDVVVYGAGSFPGVTPHPGGIDYGHSLVRKPPWADIDNCARDFRDQPYPSPGETP